VQAYSGKGATHNLTNVDSSAVVYYHLVVRDLFGDSAVSTDSFVFPRPLGVIDIDGNVYPTMIIGNQVWTTVNLRVTRYNDGTSIPLVTDGGTWGGLSTPGYCFYNNSTDAGEQEKWGALYNWYAVETGKLAPAGWRVPTDADWTELSDYLGGESFAGGKMKEAGTTNWASPNTGADNSSGFSALPGGYRYGDGHFYNQSFDGYWWSATENAVSDAYYRYLYFDYELLVRSHYYKQSGFFVRLVRNID
jgi:uncharacterized protein (TIGR02145 family)